MNPELLALCQRRYGPRWQSPLARDICRVVPSAQFRSVLRTVQRLAAGDTDATPFTEAAIRLLAAVET